MAELSIIEKVIALEAVDLFQSLNAEQLSRIAGIAKEVSFPPEKTIVTPETEMDALYVILDGEIELSRSGESFHLARRGDVLGSWALFDETPLSLGAHSVTDVRVLKISRTEFFDLLSDNMQITAAIFRTLVKRFRQLAGN